jgi:hypothetical protein
MRSKDCLHVKASSTFGLSQRSKHIGGYAENDLGSRAALEHPSAALAGFAKCHLTALLRNSALQGWQGRNLHQQSIRNTSGSSVVRNVEVPGEPHVPARTSTTPVMDHSLSNPCTLSSRLTPDRPISIPLRPLYLLLPPEPARLLARASNRFFLFRVHRDSAKARLETALSS